MPARNSELTLSSGWHVLQDVHDSGERLGLHRDAIDLTTMGSQLSEWAPIERLAHLQTLFASTPYWGRELRHFNQAPWWYRTEFFVDGDGLGELSYLRFSNVDYFGKVWLNGELLGEHEGYSDPFEFDVSSMLREGRNVLTVKVWSPWDSTVDGDGWKQRFFHVARDMVKGTYEHDDGFIARDVNPVGIYGSVTVSSFAEHRVRRPAVDYDLDQARGQARVRVSGRVDAAGAVPAEVRVEIAGGDGEPVATTAAVSSDGEYAASVELSGVRVWETWDRGVPELYTVRVTAPGHATEIRTGFRDIAMIRTEEETTLVLNGRRFFVRGASYFPDVYVSRMDAARYRRDLEAAKRAGINLLRVHVHVEHAEFYELCDELGIAVMQDSEFNWTHSGEEEWTERLLRVFRATIGMLAHHPSLVTWVCLNEPGGFGEERYQEYMYVRPGPQLVAAVRELDPSRTFIKGSGAKADPDSRDTHNYVGSLMGEQDTYTAIDGSEEHLNTEFGFDAPGALENLRETGSLFRRLEPIVPVLGDIQHYQYRYLKYYIEHYRVQRFGPCSGYVQFMLIDLGPNSYYGVYDWWGTAKPGLDALLESNQPLAVILAQTAGETSAVWFVNDTLADLGEVEVTWSASDASGSVVEQGAQSVKVPADSVVEVAPLVLSADLGHVDVELVVTAAGEVVATNRYRGLFDHPPHPKGHPHRMSHEYGTRLYSA